MSPPTDGATAAVVRSVAADPAAPIRLAVDLMGGDHGPDVTLPACRAFLAAHPAAELVLVGRAEAIARAEGWPRCTRIAASEVIEMTDSVETALRRKKDSSLRVAVSQVKPLADRPSLAQACVSAGNTGALMAVSRYVLKTTFGIDRPAIATLMPNEHDGFTTVLDLGANVDCTAEHLLQFAVMGSALVTAVSGKAEPTVGLLNIGEEAIKGGEAIKAAAELLREAAAAGIVNFHGNVEANDIFKGTTDIVVCDGFVGNVMLKTAEGLASMLTTFIKQEFTRNALTKVAALAALPVLRRFKTRVDPRRYNGAALLGLRGLVFKSHGSADAFAFEHALARAHDAAKNGLLDRVQHRIQATLAALPATAQASETGFDDSTAFGGVQSA
ncbi:MAG TPA: phosphate acyltransferase PlsX [Caldimonas sp.]|jgi:glycerol-3-phosphate acyltransferase PlsX